MGVVDAVQVDANNPLEHCSFILFQRLSVCLERNAECVYGLSLRDTVSGLPSGNGERNNTAL
jgi:hypothetical protein